MGKEGQIHDQAPNTAQPAAHSSSKEGIALPAVPVFQLAHNGKKTMAEVPGLVTNLQEMGFLADDEQRNQLVRMLAMNKNFEESDIIAVFMGDAKLGSADIAPAMESKEKKRKQEDSDLEEGSDFDVKPFAAAAGLAREERIEVKFPPRTRAILVWAGSALTEFQLAPIRHAYISAYGDRPLKGQGEMDEEAGLIEKTAKFELLPVSKGAIQQALEQEFIHAEVVNTICKKLDAVGLVPTVIRPPDSSLIRPKALSGVPWLPLGSKIDLSETANSILITVGHGGPGGHTNFPGQGLLDYTKIRALLGIPDIGSAVLYIPLQCFPQKAVRAGKAGGAYSVSIFNEEKSDDGEMKDWIEAHLKSEIIQWAESRVGK